MNANHLLLWMSARQKGSWAQFRAAVEELQLSGDENTPESSADESDQYSLPIYQALRLNLQRLGHAEFVTEEDKLEWRITPPSLALTRQPWGWRAVVAGARTIGIIARLTEAAASSLETICAPECPDFLRVSAPEPESLVAIGRQAGFLTQGDAAMAILQSVPCVDDPCMLQSRPIPVGTDWRIERFCPDSLRWDSASRGDAQKGVSGVFRLSFGHQRLIYWCSRGRSWNVPGQVAKYRLLRKRRKNVVHYDPVSRRFAVPLSCRPPLLVERGLALCSGVLPRFDPRSGRLEYSDVPASVAGLCAGVLRQELR